MNMHVAGERALALAISRHRALCSTIAKAPVEEPMPAPVPVKEGIGPLLFGLPSFYWTRMRRDRGSDGRISDIIDLTAARFGIARGDLLSERRTKNVILPRHVAVYLSRIHTQKSYPFIAKRFGYFDHSVIVFAVSKIERLLKTDSSIALHVEALSLEIGALA